MARILGQLVFKVEFHNLLQKYSRFFFFKSFSDCTVFIEHVYIIYLYTIRNTLITYNAHHCIAFKLLTQTNYKCALSLSEIIKY